MAHLVPGDFQLTDDQSRELQFIFDQQKRRHRTRWLQW
jgi:hypothetical protein